MRLMKLTHTDGRTGYLAADHVTAVMPPPSASPGPDVIPGSGPGAVVHLTGGEKVLVLEGVDEVRQRLEAADKG